MILTLVIIQGLDDLIFFFARIVFIIVDKDFFLLQSVIDISFLSILMCAVQNRLLAMNYIDEGHDEKLFEAHRFLLSPMNFLCISIDC